MEERMGYSALLCDDDTVSPGERDTQSHPLSLIVRLALGVSNIRPGRAILVGSFGSAADGSAHDHFIHLQ
jgi:hypothetical protein